MQVDTRFIRLLEVEQFNGDKMSHFAKVENGRVTQVIVVEQDVISTGVFGDPSLWVQTSYNTQGNQHPEGRPLRKNFAGVGYTYDPVLDAFIPPKPFESWILDENTCLWNPPIPYPSDGKIYEWNESSRMWLLINLE